MSRWLKSVNTLLEQLDGTVETAIEEQAVRAEGDLPGQGKDAVESILARRGLSDEIMDEGDLDSNSPIANSSEPALPSQESTVETESLVPSTLYMNDPQVKKNIDPDSQEDCAQAIAEDQLHPETVDGSISKDENEGITEERGKTGDTASKAKDVVDLAPPKATPTVDLETSETNKSEPVELSKEVVNSTPSHNYKKAMMEARESEKEARTLRRHVVRLNTELEAAEREIQAQRSELERAGDRMEKDRMRYKEEKERMAARHAEEIRTLKKQQEVVLQDVKGRSNQQLEEARNRLHEVEEKRMREGGDWTKELETAVKREQEVLRSLAVIEDERATLLSQISSLQAQLDRSESRVYSITQTADNALLRERDAEDKLDLALSMHARQLSQRQAREAELERTIADLGAALASARRNDGLTGDGSDSSSPEETGSNLRERIRTLEDELENEKALHETERQRAQLMQRELRDVSRERAEEASAMRAKQLQFDRQVAAMSLTISKLESNLREAQRSLPNKSDHITGLDGNEENSIKELSEKVMLQQEKLERTTSEVSALRSRLQTAIGRAEKAEEALSAIDSFGTESAPSSGNVGPRLRKWGGKRKQSVHVQSIRSALILNDTNENTQNIGKAIDAVDRFSVDAGKFLRRNPLARGGFLLYLLILHLWTFALLFFHTHGDFGSVQTVAHGPHVLMKNADQLKVFNNVKTGPFKETDTGSTADEKVIENEK